MSCSNATVPVPALPMLLAVRAARLTDVRADASAYPMVDRLLAAFGLAQALGRGYAQGSPKEPE